MNGPSLALEVGDLDQAPERLKSADAPVLAEGLESPVCRFALITDPDGNGLMIHQRKTVRGCEASS